MLPAYFASTFQRRTRIVAMTLVFVDGTLFSRGRLSEKKLRRTVQRAASVDGDQPTSRKAGAP
jgi:hypothetical protein